MYPTRLGEATARWDMGVESTNAAIEELSRARTIQPDNAWIYLQIGNIRRRQGEWADAIANYERAGDYLPHLFGTSGYALVRDPLELPRMLPRWYARLTL